MIKKLEFIHYRKLKNISIDFKEGINIISGTNGTCKTSILHLISNSFKRPKNSNGMNIVGSLNNNTNPKIETLTKGDKKYFNPAYGTTGILYKAEYYNHDTLGFRRKNDKIYGSKNRFRLIPVYSKEGEDSLPEIPVIYLGLTRLVSSGEIDNDKFDKKRDLLPLPYQNELVNLYYELSGQKIDVSSYNIMELANLKTRADFITSEEGIDSNTISDGQDNLHMILTALVSLKYYFETFEKPSILLIDEFDATLHPDLQRNLLNVMKDFSSKYQIQVVFTTHSLGLLETTIKKKDIYNVIYLDDKIESVGLLKDEMLDIYSLKARLYNITENDILSDKYIPIYTEDEQAREFLKILLDYLFDRVPELECLRKFFICADSYLGCDNLKKLFKDGKCSRQFINCIGILDGDVDLKKQDMNYNLIKLPGKMSIEELVFSYSKELYNQTKDNFWDSDSIQRQGFTKPYYRDHILKDIENIPKKINSSKKEKRELNKACFTKINNHDFFIFVLKYWVRDEGNKQELEYFYNGLLQLFNKTSELNGINRKYLKIEKVVL